MIENPSKSEVIGRCGGDEKKRMTTQKRQKFNAKKKSNKSTYLLRILDVVYTSHRHITDLVNHKLVIRKMRYSRLYTVSWFLGVLAIHCCNKVNRVNLIQLYLLFTHEMKIS